MFPPSNPLLNLFSNTHIHTIDTSDTPLHFKKQLLTQTSASTTLSSPKHLSQSYREHTSLCPSKISRPSVSSIPQPSGISSTITSVVDRCARGDTACEAFLSIDCVLNQAFEKDEFADTHRPLRRSRRRHWGN